MTTFDRLVKADLQKHLAWTFPLFLMGIGQRFPFSFLGEHGILIGRIVWTLLTVCWYLILFSSPRFLARLPKGLLFVAGALAATAAFDLLQFHHYKEFGYHFPLGLLIFDVVAGAILIACYHFSRSSWKTIAAFALYPLMHRGLSILTFPLAMGRSDMLIAIGEAAERVLRGANPYAVSSIGTGRMLYLPGTWISYLPAQLLNIELRWVGLFWFALLIAVVVYPHTRRALSGGVARSTDAGLNNSSLILFLWLTNPLLHYRHELYLDFFWLTLVLAFRNLAQDKTGLRERVATWLAGLVCAITLQWGWITLPFIALFSFKPKSLVQAVGSVVVTLAALFASLLAFRLIWGRDFLDAIFIVLGHLQGDLCFGFTPILYGTNFGWMLRALQIGVLFSMGCVGLVRSFGIDRWSGPEMLRWAAFTLMTFIALNGFIEYYFYFAPLLLFALKTDLRSEASTVSDA